MAVAGSYAYVADGDRGLRIINISNPAAPTEIGFYDTPGICLTVWRWPVTMPMSLMDWSGLRIIDISNPAAPTEVGFYDTPGVCLWMWRWPGAMLT